MRDVLTDIRRWRARGERVALATVVATRKSAPRPVGSKLAVSKTGEMAGPVSGGCVEKEVFGHACDVLAGGDAQVLTYWISDDLALTVGLPCGGEIDVFVDAPDEELLERLARVVESGERAVLFTVVDGEGLGDELLATEEGGRVGQGPEEALARLDEVLRGGHNRLLELEDGRRVFAEVFGPPPRLLVIGWRTIVADARATFATKERLPSADEVLTAWPQDAIARIEPDHQTAVVVLTHDHKFDVPAIKGALESEAFYIGALGSRRNQERRRMPAWRRAWTRPSSSSVRAVRPRHRRRQARVDERLDHGGDHGRALGARRWAAPRLVGPDSRRDSQLSLRSPAPC